MLMPCDEKKRVAGNQYFGMQIGLTLSVSIVCIGRISGSCLNSAVWLGTVIPAIATDQIKHNLSDAWLYWIATLLAGLVSGLLFNLFNGQGVVHQTPDGYASPNMAEDQNIDSVEMRAIKSKDTMDQYTEVSAANID